MIESVTLDVLARLGDDPDARYEFFRRFVALAQDVVGDHVRAPRCGHGHWPRQKDLNWLGATAVLACAGLRGEPASPLWDSRKTLMNCCRSTWHRSADNN